MHSLVYNSISNELTVELEIGHVNAIPPLGVPVTYFISVKPHLTTRTDLHCALDARPTGLPYPTTQDPPLGTFLKFVRTRQNAKQEQGTRIPSNW